MAGRYSHLSEKPVIQFGGRWSDSSDETTEFSDNQVKKDDDFNGIKSVFNIIGGGDVNSESDDNEDDDGHIGTNDPIEENIIEEKFVVCEEDNLDLVDHFVGSGSVNEDEQGCMDNMICKKNDVGGLDSDNSKLDKEVKISLNTDGVEVPFAGEIDIKHKNGEVDPNKLIFGCNVDVIRKDTERDSMDIPNTSRISINNKNIESDLKEALSNNKSTVRHTDNERRSSEIVPNDQIDAKYKNDVGNSDDETPPIYKSVSHSWDFEDQNVFTNEDNDNSIKSKNDIRRKFSITDVLESKGNKNNNYDCNEETIKYIRRKINYYKDGSDDNSEDISIRTQGTLQISTFLDDLTYSGTTYENPMQVPAPKLRRRDFTDDEITLVDNKISKYLRADQDSENSKPVKLGDVASEDSISEVKRTILNKLRAKLGMDSVSSGVPEIQKASDTNKRITKALPPITQIKDMINKPVLKDGEDLESTATEWVDKNNNNYITPEQKDANNADGLEVTILPDQLNPHLVKSTSLNQWKLKTGIINLLNDAIKKGSTLDKARKDVKEPVDMNGFRDVDEEPNVFHHHIKIYPKDSIATVAPIEKQKDLYSHVCFTPGPFESSNFSLKCIGFTLTFEFIKNMKITSNNNFLRIYFTISRDQVVGNYLEISLSRNKKSDNMFRFDSINKVGLCVPVSAYVYVNFEFHSDNECKFKTRMPIIDTRLTSTGKKYLQFQKDVFENCDITRMANRIFSKIVVPHIIFDFKNVDKRELNEIRMLPDYTIFPYCIKYPLITFIDYIRDLKSCSFNYNTQFLSMFNIVLNDYNLMKTFEAKFKELKELDPKIDFRVLFPEILSNLVSNNTVNSPFKVQEIYPLRFSAYNNDIVFF